MTKQNSRRTFLKNTALAAAGSFFIVPRHVLGKGYVAPSDKLNLASIGAGGKGSSDIANAYNKGVNNVTALCDVDWARAKASIDKFPDAKKYKDWRKMFDQMGKDIDAVTISTPDHNHAAIASAAMQMGKHVYVQKPLTHNIYEARWLTEAARKYKVVSQMGNQGASNPEQKLMVDWFNTGKIGPVHTVYIWTNRPVWPQGIPVPSGKPDMPEGIDWDTWIGPAQWVDYHPGYHPFKWRGWWNFGTGALGDIGCHTIDTPFRVLGLNYPTEVECSVGAVFLKDWTPEWIPEGCPPSSQVQIKFPATAKNKSSMKMIWMDGGLRPFHPDMLPAGEPISTDGGANGVMMIGTKGMIACDMYGQNPRMYLKNGDKTVAPKVERKPDDMPEYGHQILWTEACKQGFGGAKHKALTSSFDYSGPLTETVLMGNLAIRSYMLRRPKGNGFDYYGRQKLLWDGNNMKITNFEDANQFVKREYRDGWKLV